MAPSSVLQVFGQPASTDVARVLACLFERNLHFELVRTDAVNRARRLPAGASAAKTSWARRRELIFLFASATPNASTSSKLTLCCLSPFLHARMQCPGGHVTLKHGGTTLTDSRDICRYVCTEFPRDHTSSSLYGAGSLERASIERWLRTEARSFDAPSAATASRYYHLALAPIAAAGEEHGGGVGETESEQQLRRVLSVYDDALARTRYLAGDEFTLADMSHLPNAHRLAGSEMGRTLLGSVKNVARWYEAVSARPAWQRVIATQSGRAPPRPSARGRSTTARVSSCRCAEPVDDCVESCYS
ncbi:hypothetical protein ACQ4PT_033916 [Festuca glaucescens]